METIPLFGPYALRRLRTEDAPDIFASIDTQRRYLGRWLPFVADTHRIEQTRQVVAGMLADTANPVFIDRTGGECDDTDLRRHGGGVFRRFVIAGGEHRAAE